MKRERGSALLSRIADFGSEGRSPRARRPGSAGFIQTLEFLVILSVFGSVLVAGIHVFNKWLMEKVNFVSGNHIFIYDSTPAGALFVGRAQGFNTQQAPIIFYRPIAAQPGITALLGVRDDHFTTPMAVYYDGDGCTGNAFVLNVTEPDAGDYRLPYPSGADPLSPLADFYMLQSDVATSNYHVFAMGSPTVLYKSASGAGAVATAADFTLNDNVGIGEDLAPDSVYVSERYIAQCRTLGENYGIDVPNPADNTLLRVDATSYVPTTGFVTPFWVPAQASGALTVSTAPTPENTAASDQWNTFTPSTGEDQSPP